MHPGRNVIEVTESPRFAARCLDRGVAVARELLDSVKLGINDVGVLIASQYPVDFAIGIAHRLEIPSECVPQPELERTHTAGPIAALEAAIVTGQLARARYTLFVTAGAGPTIAAAVYRG